MPRSIRPLAMPLALGGVSVLAIAGQLVFNQAVATIGRGLGQNWTVFTPGFDFWPIWFDDRLFVKGHGTAHWYGAGLSNAWPPPHEVLLSPFSLLSYDHAHVASMIVTAALMVFAVVLWSRESVSTQGGFGIAWPILLSAPVFGVIWIDQLQAALGLAALSLAIWAQRRDHWWLVGISAAVGMIRPLNAIPVLGMLLLGGWRKPRQLVIAVAAATAFVAPLLFISYLWDHSFITDYFAGIAAYPFNAAPKVATHSFGTWGLALLLGVGCAAAVWLVRKDVGRPLDPGRTALAMGLTVALAPVGGLYPAIFALPALIRLGRQPRFTAIPWIAAIAPWAIILGGSPWLLGPNPGTMVNSVSFIDYGLLLLAYPILRNPPETEGLALAA